MWTMKSIRRSRRSRKMESYDFISSRLLHSHVNQLLLYIVIVKRSLNSGVLNGCRFTLFLLHSIWMLAVSVEKMETRSWRKYFPYKEGLCHCDEMKWYWILGPNMEPNLIQQVSICLGPRLVSPAPGLVRLCLSCVFVDGIKTNREANLAC